MADLFQTSRTIVVEHLKHIYDEEKLSQEVTCRKFRQVRKEGDRQGHPGVEALGTSFTTSSRNGARTPTSFPRGFRRWRRRIRSSRTSIRKRRSGTRRCRRGRPSNGMDPSLLSGSAMRKRRRIGKSGSGTARWRWSGRCRTKTKSWERSRSSSIMGT